MPLCHPIELGTGGIVHGPIDKEVAHCVQGIDLCFDIAGTVALRIYKDLHAFFLKKPLVVMREGCPYFLVFDLKR